MEGLTLDLIGLQLFTGLALGAVYVLLAIGPGVPSPLDVIPAKAGTQ